MRTSAPRILIGQIDPAAFQAMDALESYLATAGIPAIQRELMSIRASQINGCSYCIRLHTRKALAHGETTERIAQLSSWRESSLFTDEEKAVLALTEELTSLSASGVSDETYSSVMNYFSPQQYAAFVMVIVTINSWNRIMRASE